MPLELSFPILSSVNKPLCVWAVHNEGIASSDWSYSFQNSVSDTRKSYILMAFIKKET